jgi:aminoglycoside/choline kinase family phosphotransferase
MLAPDNPEDFERQVAMSAFLRPFNVGTPVIYHVSEKNRTVAMEDLGGESLAAAAQQAAEAADPERALSEIYGKTLQHLVRFQTETLAATLELAPFEEDGPTSKPRLFGRAHLRWETRYFRDEFLAAYAGLHEETLAPLDVEFDASADAVSAHPKTLVHRDFQSTNIILKTDGTIGIVDFQGARLGPFLYDLASLVNDPYRNLSSGLRASLLKRYFDAFAESALPELLAENAGETGANTRFAEPDALRGFRGFEELFNAAAAQRAMQALGAYAFLGLKKGKRRYLDFIPRGLELLNEILEESAGNASKPRFPRLSAVVADLTRRFAR